jgi:transglutaminase-like putative cysteine protease
MNPTDTSQQIALQVLHRTSYDYAEPVSLSLHQAMLKPRTLAGQTVANSYINIEPTPRSLDFRVDYYGNLVLTSNSTRRTANWWSRRRARCT